ncbi:DUF4224 domain-containing protein [Variovorax sp. DXTD-1]|uniref:DUF4224 domain-containing protein n=1 Tax=Variovorax sp. DXTD-1 TaxID=2495592 RepID=UPI000F86E54E|nr:DUF4224 domain-containing protein [Variovorax sp. DXTD-1]RST54143.1 DUF4224 domain-containing protein [Variovorax sp. DXTD-1]
MSALFLSDEELIVLTGFTWKSKQIRWLQSEGIPFRKSATGHPVVTRSAIEGRPVPAQEAQPVRGWVPRVVGA